jgi:hypothetical protein
MYKLLLFILVINIFLSYSKLSLKEKMDKAKKIVDKANAHGKYKAKYIDKIAQLDDPKLILGAKIKGASPPPSYLNKKKHDNKSKKDKVDYFDVRTSWPECRNVVGTIQVNYYYFLKLFIEVPF